MAYERKEWSIGNLVTILERQAEALAIRWGWQEDPATPVFAWVLYVDLPTGQVSFHTSARGAGPQYDVGWDGFRGASPGRIIRWCEVILAGVPRAPALPLHEEARE